MSYIAISTCFDIFFIYTMHTKIPLTFGCTVKQPLLELYYMHEQFSAYRGNWINDKLSVIKIRGNK